jgi:hypothetical protein
VRSTSSRRSSSPRGSASAIDSREKRRSSTTSCPAALVPELLDAAFQVVDRLQRLVEHLLELLVALSLRGATEQGPGHGTHDDVACNTNAHVKTPSDANRPAARGPRPAARAGRRVPASGPCREQRGKPWRPAQLVPGLANRSRRMGCRERGGR